MKAIKCYQLILLLASFALALSCTLISTPMTTPFPSIATLTPTPIPPTATLLPCYILFANESSGYDIFVHNCDGSNTRRLTEGRTYGKAMSWSPDGQHIIYDVLSPVMEWDSGEIYIMNADGSNKTRLLGPGSAYLPSWSPDGERIVFMDGCDIKTMRPDGSDIVLVMEGSKMAMHAGDPAMCPFAPAWSPDSKQIVFFADDFDALQAVPPGPYLHRIAVVNADGTGLYSLVDFFYPLPDGPVLTDPCWSPDGQQVAYTLRDSQKGTVTFFLVNADGSGEPVEIYAIPDSWYPWYWPQWSH